jgi:hypothetical protein
MTEDSLARQDQFLVASKGAFNIDDIAGACAGA